MKGCELVTMVQVRSESTSLLFVNHRLKTIHHRQQKKDTLLLKISMLRFSTKNIFLMTNTREEDWKIRNVTASRSQEFYFYCLSTTAIAFNDFAPSKVEKIYILWGRWKFLFSYIFILEWHAIKTNKKQMLWLPQWLLLQTEKNMMLF